MLPVTDAFPAIMAAALGPLSYTNATLRHYVRAEDGEGGGTLVSTDHAVMAQREAATLAMRSEPGYSATDVRFLILQHGVAVVPSLDDRLLFDGRWYKLAGSIGRDPANVYWDVRGVSV